MSNLGPQQQNQTFNGLLQVPGGVAAQLQTVQDGDGNTTALKVGSQNVQIGDVVDTYILQIPGGVTTSLQTVLDGNGNPTGLQLSSSGASVTTSDTFIASKNGTQITGSVPRLISDGFGDYISVKDFGATGNGVTDDTASIQAALDYANSIGGTTIFFPAGQYKTTATLILYPKTTLVGQGGYTASIISYTGLSDGIKTTSPINSSTNVSTQIKDLYVYCSNASNAGGAFVNVAGSYVQIISCSTSGFKYGVIFDQTEHGHILLSNIGATYACVWLVNGGDHTVGALPLFTNRITIDQNQFNVAAGVTCISDDGGVNHAITNNNFNAGGNQIRAANVYGLTISNNEMEGATGRPIWFADTTNSGTTVGYIEGFSITDNTIGGGTTSIYIDGALNGVITSNVVYQYSSSAFGQNYGSNHRTQNVVISNNSKIVIGNGKTQTKLFDNTSYWQPYNDVSNQSFQSYVSSGAISAGSNTVTVGTTELLNVGMPLFATNTDNTNPEVVIITALSATQITATFASSKSANFTLRSLPTYEGSFTPTISGASSTDTITYTDQTGWYSLNNGVCTFSADVTWSNVGTSSGQLQFVLPVRSASNTGTKAFALILSGAGANVSGTIYGTNANFNRNVAVGYVASNTGAATAINISSATSGTISISGSYRIY